MTFFQAVKLVNPLDISAHTIADGKADINNVEFIGSSQDFFSEDTLYLCEPETLPLHLPEEQLYSFFVFGKLSSLPPQLRRLRLNLVMIEKSVDAVDVMNQMKRSLHIEERIRNGILKLNAALFSNRGLQNLIRCAYEILGNPLLVWDNSENCIAKEIGGTEIDPDSNFARMMNTESPDPALDAKAVGYVKKIRYPDSCLMNGQIRRFHNEYFDLEQMTAGVRIYGILSARVNMFSYNRPFTELDEAMFRELIPFIGQELQKDSQFKKNRNENKAYFLNALLSVSDITQGAIQRMLMFRDIADVKDKFYVIVIEPSEHVAQVDQLVLQTVAQQLKPVLSGSFHLIRDTELVILLNLPNSRSMKGFIDDTLRQQALVNKLMIGVSNQFRDLTLTKKHYRQAKEAIDLNIAYRSWPVAYFSLIAPVRVLHIVREHDDLLSYCMPELLDLLRIDQQANLDYMPTLYYYLESFGSSSAAAAKLHVHKNTLLYRLGKIKEIIGRDLSDGEDIYKLMMSFRILRTLNMFKPIEYERGAEGLEASI